MFGIVHPEVEYSYRLRFSCRTAALTRIGASVGDSNALGWPENDRDSHLQTETSVPVRVSGRQVGQGGVKDG